jgi:Na+/melibiose symporter-like transporter
MFRGWLTIIRNRAAVTVSFIQACQYYVYGVVEFYLVQYMTEVAGLNALEVSVVMGVQVVCFLFLDLCWGVSRIKEADACQWS